MAILNATIESWTGPDPGGPDGLGALDTDGLDLIDRVHDARSGSCPKPVTTDDVLHTDLLPAAQ